MVPTLLIISVVTFTIIQLPPGDFVETRIMELQATGDETAVKEAERLREMFFLDDPGYKQYARWMGLYWFKSFDEADGGLLQGNMGRSMETQKTVNDVVGDRVLLTVLVSLGTILHPGHRAAHRHLLGGQAVLMGRLHPDIPRFHRHVRAELPAGSRADVPQQHLPGHQCDGIVLCPNTPPRRNGPGARSWTC